jgi:ATP-dependent Clp protease ATP-binding subunit ClpX
MDLDEDALVEILSRPKNALVKQYQRLFTMEDVDLNFTDGALIEIAKKAILRKTGARGLRSIMEDILLDTMFELPGLEGVGEVMVNADVVKGKTQPLYIYTKNKKGEAGATAGA